MSIQTMKKALVRGLLVASYTIPSFFLLQAQNFFPDTGFAAILQRCRDVQGNLSVLNISLRPGEEDFQTLSYLRLEKGYKLLSVYITNGEFTESDSAELYPHQNAAVHREEATSAMAMLESAVSFMNFPVIEAYTTESDISKIWPRDTLETRLFRMIGHYKPDIIIYSHTISSFDSMLHQYVLMSILKVVKNLKSAKRGDNKLREDNIYPWNVDRILIRTSTRHGLKAPLTTQHSYWKQSYREIGENIFSQYRSLSALQTLPEKKEPPLYQSMVGLKKQFTDLLNSGLSQSMPRTLRKTYFNIQANTKAILARGSVPRNYLSPLASIIDSVDKLILKTRENRPRERRILIGWKEGLEKLRTAILGVSVEYSLDYSIVTERQLLNIKIDTISNLPASGTTMIVFPAVDRDWVVNESKKSYLPLTLKEEYRLLSPSIIPYDIPAEQFYQGQPLIHRPLPVMIIHQDNKREESFIYRISPKIKYSPRFTAEILTPIVRCIEGEKLIIRLTNHSRDGVSDFLAVNDILAVSNMLQVALPEKESSSIDTLTLSWNSAMRDSAYLFPIQYGGVSVGGFLARKFSLNIDSGRSLAVITGWQRSETIEAMRRLELQKVKIIQHERILDSTLKSIQTAFVDRRAMTFRPFTDEEKLVLRSFVSNGGHLIIFSQDAASWNDNPFIDGVHLEPTAQWKVETPLKYDSTEFFFASPNIITVDDFKNWIIHRAYNKVMNHSSEVRVLLSSEDGSPLILEKSFGKGKIVYIDLALSPQLMNIHEGAFRILANIIAL